jgi:hypothetical protein
MDLREVGLSGMDFIDVAHNRAQWRVLVNTVMNLPKKRLHEVSKLVG